MQVEIQIVDPEHFKIHQRHTRNASNIANYNNVAMNSLGSKNEQFASMINESRNSVVNYDQSLLTHNTRRDGHSLL